MASHDVPLGFDGLVPSGSEEPGKGGEYTVEFTMTDTADSEPLPEKRGTSEEIGLLEPKSEDDETEEEKTREKV